MQPLSRLVAVAAVALVAASCSGSGPTPVASSTPPSTTSPTATASATLIPFPGPPIPAGTLTLKVVAMSFGFDVSKLSVPANTPFAIHFDNEQKGVSHNVAIRRGLEYLFKPPPFAGLKAVDYFISEGLPAGTYTFACTVHPQMEGHLVVG